MGDTARSDDPVGEKPQRKGTTDSQPELIASAVSAPSQRSAAVGSPVQEDVNDDVKRK
jgi:hypothetical protein